MSNTQYIKMLEREINKLNKIIDLKIMKGEAYRKEAHDHKLLLRKVRFHKKQNILRRIFPLLSLHF